MRTAERVKVMDRNCRRRRFCRVACRGVASLKTSLSTKAGELPLCPNVSDGGSF
ncbi:hypothetical protein [Sinorhizobium meliloti]|uniref:hypothetical protein n=1 Tax=Rhizobium meliloti TaxID=382 RepID=UPI0018658E3C|nr:hypothetical protein [Sinorhizobium meliloti]